MIPVTAHGETNPLRLWAWAMRRLQDTTRVPEWFRNPVRVESMASNVIVTVSLKDDERTEYRQCEADLSSYAEQEWLNITGEQVFVCINPTTADDVPATVASVTTNISPEDFDNDPGIKAALARFEETLNSTN